MTRAEEETLNRLAAEVLHARLNSEDLMEVVEAARACFMAAGWLPELPPEVGRGAGYVEYAFKPSMN